MPEEESVLFRVKIQSILHYLLGEAGTTYSSGNIKHNIQTDSANFQFKSNPECNGKAISVEQQTNRNSCSTNEVLHL